MSFTVKMGLISSSFLMTIAWYSYILYVVCFAHRTYVRTDRRTWLLVVLDRSFVLYLRDNTKYLLFVVVVFFRSISILGFNGLEYLFEEIKTARQLTAIHSLRCDPIRSHIIHIGYRRIGVSSFTFFPSIFGRIFRRRNSPRFNRSGLYRLNFDRNIKKDEGERERKKQI